MSKKIIVVLGMARSGTSVVAKGLQAIGVYLGERLREPSRRWNPKGFWEDTEIVYKINRAVLYALKEEWMSINFNTDFTVPPEWDALKRHAIVLLQSRMAQTDRFGFKDPRTAKILPFWQSVFGELGLDDRYIIALRNPLSSARSYQYFSDCDLEQALLLWLTHLVRAVDGVKGKPSMVVSYAKLMQHPRAELERIRKGLQLSESTSGAELEQYAKEFLDPKLNRYGCDDATWTHDPAVAVAPLCQAVYQLLFSVAQDEMTLHDERFTVAWQLIKEQLAKVIPAYHYIDRLLKKGKRLDRRLHTISGSIPWKLLYPLRFIHQGLRLSHRKVKKQFS
jgi:hypothetical protein